MAYRKGDIPKVKLNIPNAPKFDLDDLIEPMSNMDTLFDNILKDIKEQKDNAMAMEFTKCIGELLKKNGVVPKITECTANLEKDKNFESRYGVTIDELDFSEHDKVFEDKIELLNRNLNLQKDKRCEEEIERNYLAGRFSQLKSENDELNQRIAELESKGTESLDEVPDSITIDGYKCKIIKTESGLYISRDEIYSIIDKEKEPLKQKCKELENRHQSDCIEINRLNTTIDVLIHKVEYLRQFAGLE